MSVAYNNIREVLEHFDVVMQQWSYGKEYGQAQKDGKGSDHASYPGNEPPVLPVSHMGSPTYEYTHEYQ